MHKDAILNSSRWHLALYKMGILCSSSYCLSHERKYMEYMIRNNVAYAKSLGLLEWGISFEMSGIIIVYCL